MILADVNVFIYAARKEMPDHHRYAAWLAHLLTSGEPYAVSDLVLSGFVRVSTNPRAFQDPLPVAAALSFCDPIRSSTSAISIHPQDRHWGIFNDLCRRVGARGKLVPDTYFAALAIEHGCVWVTSDDDYRRFPGLRWRKPFDDQITTNP